MPAVTLTNCRLRLSRPASHRVEPRCPSGSSSRVTWRAVCLAQPPSPYADRIARLAAL